MSLIKQDWKGVVLTRYVVSMCSICTLAL